ncbi:hypothetical protein A3842_26935 [Paenibacillus sp. P3E]|uniref:hypothetical protein n=1 Tax=unclassified Paenibacillus TaxID=185978 RepID=UPI00093EB829|nr:MULTISPECIES: hypothetical protein [unclassified Paenibacillus]OKP68347.1 hypothetical protein A3842_26935 [Paenibacillus sp. P3E]OKP88699.1 hypothetical protein A3848_17190 [Paenibacillus sp. P32E]
MRIISRSEAAEILTIKAVIRVMGDVLTDLARGEAVQSLRQVLPLLEGNLMGLMPGYLRREAALCGPAGVRCP